MRRVCLFDQPKKWVQVKATCTVRELVRLEGHIIAQFPVLHVVARGSVFEAHMLASDPSDFLPPPALGHAKD